MVDVDDNISDEIQWLTTAANPAAHTCETDDGQQGWRLHAVRATKQTRFKDLGRQPALCGTRPARGWGLDLFVNTKCKRCLRALDKEQKP